MPTYTEHAVVLRTHKLGEADRIVSMLTYQRGIVRAVAKGVRRTKSKFGARLEPGSIVEVMCYEGKNLDTINQAAVVSPLALKLAEHYDSYTATVAMLEVTEKIIGEEDSSPAQFRLLCQALDAMAARTRPSSLVLDAYMLRSMSIAGWAPNFAQCVSCGVDGPHHKFMVARGGALCTQCAPPDAQPVSPASLELLGALLSGDWAVARASEEHTRHEAARITTAYVQWYVERGIRSLPLVERT